MGMDLKVGMALVLSLGGVGKQSLRVGEAMEYGNGTEVCQAEKMHESDC
jgi:hypothetical protein